MRWRVYGRLAKPLAWFAGEGGNRGKPGPRRTRGDDLSFSAGVSREAAASGDESQQHWEIKTGRAFPSLCPRVLSKFQRS